MGYIASLRDGNTGVGKTLEEYFGIVENNSTGSDFMGFEIKSHRSLSESYITLFTKSPYPDSIDCVLRESYGSPDKEFPKLKILHVSVFADQWSNHCAGFSYRLELKNNKIFLLVKNTRTGKIEDIGAIFWTYDDIRNTLHRKLKKLAFVEADTKMIHGTEYFHYKNISLYYNVSFQKFLNQLRNGNVMMDIRIGVYRTEGKNYGKTHNHGMAFRIRKEFFETLYENGQTTETSLELFYV